jgi:hypothetical protein
MRFVLLTITTAFMDLRLFSRLEWIPDAR